MKTIGYGDLSKQIHDDVGVKRIPMTGTLEVSRRCSLNCVHCYNNLPMADAAAKAKELTAEQYFRIIDQMVDEGMLYLLFTGGEVFARADFLEIYRYAWGKGLFVTVFTNATLVTDRIADALAEAPPFQIEITLYGATRETYEKMTRIPGSYDRCLAGIQKLLDRGLPVALKTVATKLTVGEIDMMQQMADEMGCAFKHDAMINARVDCGQGPLDTRLEPHEVVALDFNSEKRLAEFDEFAEQFVGQTPDPEQLYHCGGGEQAFSVDAAGNLSICVLSEDIKFDLREGSFSEGWNGFLKKVRSAKPKRVTKCTSCQLLALCGMCPANGQLEHGDAQEPVDFFCRVAHLRAYRMGYDFAPHGDCEYCEGGEKHEALLSHAVERFGDVQRVPNIGRRLAAQGAGGGCGSCGSGAADSCTPAPIK